MEIEKKHMRSMLQNISVLVISILLLFIVVECIIRTSGIFESQKEISIQFSTFERYNPNLTFLGKEYMPGKEGEMYGAYVKINSLGFRGKEYSARKSEGTERIFVLGDSMTFGLGVNNGEPYAERLEALLNTQSGKKYEVWNLGHVGHNTLQELEALKLKWLLYDPDFIIIGYHINDPECSWGGCGEDLRQATFHAYEQPFAIPLGYVRKQKLQQKSHFLRWLSLKYDASLRLIGFRDPYKDETQNLHHLGSLTWEKNKEAFASFKEISQSKNAPVLLIIFSEADYLTLDPYPYSWIHEQLKKEAEENGFYVIDLYDTFKKYDTSMLKVRSDDGHPSPFAHQLIANEIYAQLKESNFF